VASVYGRAARNHHQRPASRRQGAQDDRKWRPVPAPLPALSSNTRPVSCYVETRSPCHASQVRKVTRETSQFELQELPPLVYQLLLLSTHGQRQTILVCRSFWPLILRRTRRRSRSSCVFCGRKRSWTSSISSTANAYLRMRSLAQNTFLNPAVFCS
jgi:hypothetical protein